jgi:hypothetical protein
MKVCAISFKECWQDADGRWISSGGFPLQMSAIGDLFEAMDLIVVKSSPRPGGLPLPPQSRVVALAEPAGTGAIRKLAVVMRFRYYVSTIARHVRRADVVHVPLPGDIPLLGMLVALASRKPLVARYGGSWVTTGVTTFMNRVTRACMRRFAGGRNVMLVTGEGAQPPAPRLHWIFSTALSETELQQIQPVFDRALAAPPRLVYAGRLSSEKGVSRLIEALSILKNEGFEPLPIVTLIGEGPERPSLEAQSKALACDPCIRFAGQKARTELATEFHQADICVQPSLTEGFSKAWLDAMAHGVPVLASEVGAARAVIGTDGERGWLVPPGDVPQLASALRRILHAPIDWPALRRRCRAYAETRTLEAWKCEIARICADRWRCSIVDGKLTA